MPFPEMRKMEKTNHSCSGEGLEIEIYAFLASVYIKGMGLEEIIYGKMVDRDGKRAKA